MDKKVKALFEQYDYLNSELIMRDEDTDLDILLNNINLVKDSVWELKNSLRVTKNSSYNKYVLAHLVKDLIGLKNQVIKLKNE